MSDQIVSSSSVGDEPAFTDLLEASCPDMRVLNGRAKPSVSRERTRPDIEIVIPGEHAAAEIAYRTPGGLAQQRPISERQICIIPPGQPHKLSWQRGADVTALLIASDFLKRTAHERGMRGIEVVGQYGTFDPVVWHLGRELRGELRRHRRLDSGYIQSVANVLGRHLLSTYVAAVRFPVTAGGLPRFKLRRVVEYVHDNMADDIGFRDMAAHLKMSAYHFARMFKQSTGQSPHQYIVRCRIERAKALLSEAKLPISDIACKVGYRSQSHFTTCFGRLAGVTPGAFRAGNSL